MIVLFLLVAFLVLYLSPVRDLTLGYLAGAVMFLAGVLKLTSILPESHLENAPMPGVLFITLMAFSIYRVISGQEGRLAIFSAFPLVIFSFLHDVGLVSREAVVLGCLFIFLIVSPRKIRKALVTRMLPLMGIFSVLFSLSEVSGPVDLNPIGAYSANLVLNDFNFWINQIAYIYTTIVFGSLVLNGANKSVPLSIFLMLNLFFTSLVVSVGAYAISFMCLVYYLFIRRNTANLLDIMPLLFLYIFQYFDRFPSLIFATLAIVIFLVKLEEIFKHELNFEYLKSNLVLMAGAVVFFSIEGVWVRVYLLFVSYLILVVSRRKYGGELI